MSTSSISGIGKYMTRVNTFEESAVSVDKRAVSVDKRAVSADKRAVSANKTNQWECFSFPYDL